ncbi:DNA (cytosine-5)-methyltransferase 1 [Microbacteriaceae bacterium MWH-Ta3]|nr:DNA (cytosine-5)-methyltransferase 1 [Microbacteriaceae bacterium MWH-Ta3]
MKLESLTVVGLFAGVGGIERGFQNAGFEPLLANEIDTFASLTYRENHSHKLITADIADIDASDMPSNLTVLAGGFPCQPFSVAGYRKGFDDDRGNVFWEIMRLVDLSNPQVVFLENVKNLLGHDGGNTYRVIEAALINAGYSVTHRVLNAKTHGGIPQNRERIYVVAFRDREVLQRFSWPAEIPMKATLADFVDFENKVDDKYYYTEKTPFYDELIESVRSRETVYQWRRHYVRENKSGDCPTLTANMGMGGHNVPIVLTKFGIRKLTPGECFNLMGFPDIKFPQKIAESRLYKQAGNSVVVPVIERIARNIKQALEQRP